MPYLFTSPDTNGHGSFRAAVGAVLAELDPSVHYFYDGRDMLAAELATELWKLVVVQETSGAVAEAVEFSRSDSGVVREAEYRIAKRDDAKVYIVTDDNVVEAGVNDPAVSWSDATSREASDAP